MNRTDALAVWEDLTRELWPQLDPNQLAREADGAATITSAITDLCVHLAKAGTRGTVRLLIGHAAFTVLAGEVAVRERYGVWLEPASDEMVMRGPGSIIVRIGP